MNSTPTLITNNSFQLNNLNPQTQYNIWIRSVCSVGNSDWSILYSFTTESLPANVPYICDFENLTENSAWKSLSNSTYNWSVGSAAGNGPSVIGNQANYISNDNGLSYVALYGTVNSYIYRDIDFGTTPASYDLLFDWKCEGTYNAYYTSTANLNIYIQEPSDQISVSVLPTNPNNNLGLLYSPDTIWHTSRLSIDNVSGVKRLIFIYAHNLYTSKPAAIDNISLTQATCPRPTEVSYSNLNTTSAEITWTHTGADSYIVSYRTNNTYSTEIATTSYPYTIQGLTSGTQYMVSVKAICGTDTTIYSGEITFQTPCFDGSFSAFPYIEDFENGVSCWQQEYIAGSTSWSTTTQSHSGANGAYFTYAPNSKTKMISTSFDISTLDQPYLSFWHRQSGYDTSRDTLNVYYRETTNASWIQLFSFGSITSSYEKDSILLPNPSSTYQIAFEGCGNGYGIAIDDIKIYDNNPCAAPVNLTAQNITGSSIDVSWEAGTGTSWQITTDITSTPIDINNNSYQLNGLTFNTNYTVYVRTNCGNSSYSGWISQVFTTLPYQLPTVTTAQQIGTTQTSTTLNGSYIQGTNLILVKGFEWKELNSNTWTIVPVSAGTTPFVYSLNGLIASTQYEFRAYVETSLDTTYGETLQFTTLANTPPTVTTTLVTNITQTTATFNGTTAQGSESIQARGFEYKLNSATWAEAIDVTATGTTTINANVTGLTANTEYDVRAYAQTYDRTYGNIETFRTDSVSGLSDIETNHFLVSMYPNPTTNTTKLVVSGVDGETDIIINDVQGKLIYQTTAKAENGKVEKTIDVNNFAKGVYYVRIQNKTTSRTQKLIVIN